jgi:hypothetical protein
VSFSNSALELKGSEQASSSPPPSLPVLNKAFSRHL